MFQKMSDEELDRYTRDAEEYRRSLTGSRQSTPQGNPLHPDIASEFSEQYGGALYRPENYLPVQNGVRNVKVEKKQYSPTKKKGVRVDMNQGRLITPTANQSTNTNYYKSEPPQKNENLSPAEKIGYTIGKVYGKTIGRSLMGTAHFWTLFIIYPIQLIFAILYLISFLVLLEAGDSSVLYQLIVQYLGIDLLFNTLFYVSLIIILCVGFIQLAGVTIQAKMLQLHPLNGRGAIIKHLGFIFCLFGYLVPGLNLFPLTNAYILCIQAYPR